MNIVWHSEAWDEYKSWQNEDKKTLRRINQLIEDIERNGYHCIGKPEPLKGNLQGWWSVRIDDCNRLVFRCTSDSVEIITCKGHYSKK